jgi:hypothetical protein
MPKLKKFIVQREITAEITVLAFNEDDAYQKASEAPRDAWIHYTNHECNFELDTEEK